MTTATHGFSISTAVKRGRPTAANDNTEAYAERAATIREMRARNMTYRQIADALAMDVKTAWRAINFKAPARKPLAANDNKVVRRVAHNGGCSTTSGMAEVSLARVPTIDKPEIYPELAVAV